MKHSKLRIAWSVTWGIIIVSLAALWARSYFHCYVFADNLPPHFAIGAEEGAFVIAQSDLPEGSRKTRWGFYSILVNKSHLPLPHSFFGFGYDRAKQHWAVAMPLWFAIVLSTVLELAALKVRPDRFGRFSLIAIIVAAALVAVPLGLLVWGATE